jgi:acetyl-CoA carboxylase biotin carboxyl carrier protein
LNLEAEDVQEILRLLDAIDVDELHLETERFTLTLRRGGDGGWTQQAQVLPGAGAAPVPAVAASAPPAAASAPGTPQPPAAAASAPPETRPAAGLWEVRAPLLGTFYRAPKPGAEPFVEVGSRVEEDTVVAIVETMKLMNPVLAGARGTVVEICLADAQFAEHGAVLLRIRPEPP